jgi:uncharacterized SAM-binding protein YcdF (DUF218 family)
MNDLIFIWALPASRILGLLGSVVLATASWRAWRRTRQVTWLLFFGAFLIPIIVSAGLIVYMLATKGDPEMKDQLIKLKWAFGEVSGFLTNCLLLAGGAEALRIIRRLNTKPIK